MPHPLTLVGTHVRLEPLTTAHVPGLVVAANQDRTSYAFTHVPGTVEAAERYVASALDEQRAGSTLAFATIDAASGAVVGSTRFLELDYWQRDSGWRSAPGYPGEHAVPAVGEIGGTWLAASAQRTSINTEAKLLMLTAAFETWEVHRITFKSDARNGRSRRAIERLGAHFEGIRRAHLPATDGTIRDSSYYSIVAGEWPEIRARLRERLGR